MEDKKGCLVISWRNTFASRELGGLSVVSFSGKKPWSTYKMAMAGFE